MISYRQGDSRWADKTIPPTLLTLQRVGCLVTCIADLSTYFGDNLTPAQVMARCRFTPGALLIWASVAFATFHFDWRQYGRDDDEIEAAIADPDRAVCLQVNDGAHWVVAIGVDPLHHVFRIADPLYGDRSNMLRYRNSITGAAYLKRV